MITVTDRIDLGNNEYINLDARYTDPNGNPFSSVSAAQTYHAKKMNELFIGFTVLVKEIGWTYAKEYWVQPKGTTPETYGLVEKGAGTTDYNDLDNKPTISDGGQGSPQIPLAGNVKITATAATGGQTTGVSVTAENGGGITMAFTLEKGADGSNGTDGTNGIDGKSAYQQWLDEGNTGTETDFLNSLKAHVAGFQGVAYDSNAPTTIGDTVSAIGSLSPSADTMDKIVLMPNSDGTATIMYTTTATESGGTTTYAFSCIGELNIDTSDFLNSSNVDDTGLVNPADNALAKATDVMPLLAKLEGFDAAETKAAYNAVSGGYVSASDGSIQPTSTNYEYCEISLGDNAKRVRFLGIHQWSGGNNLPSGYALGHYVDGIWVTDTKGGFSKEGNEVGLKEYVLEVPSSATHFRTMCRLALNYSEHGSVLLDSNNCYIYILRGESVRDALNELSSRIVTVNEDYGIVSVSNCTFVNYYIGVSSSAWVSGGYSYLIPITGRKLYIKANSAESTQYGFLSDESMPVPIAGGVPNFVSGTGLEYLNTSSFPEMEREEDIPSGAKWLYVRITGYTYMYMPECIKFYGMPTEQYDTWIEADYFRVSAGTLKLYEVEMGVPYKINIDIRTGALTYLDFLDEGMSTISSLTAEAVGVIEMQDIVVPNGTKYIRVNYKINSGSITADGGAALMKPLQYARGVPKNKIVYCVSKVSSPVLPNDYDEEGITYPQTEVWSAWAFMLPGGATKRNGGKPIPLAAFFHGSSGFVTPIMMGYSSAGTDNGIVGSLLAAGIAVFDINGYGVSFTSDLKSKHWGCPLAVATAKKAYTVLTEVFNCRKGMVLSGISMGGAIIKSYAMTYPEDCVACAMEAPSEIGCTMRLTLDEGGSFALAWGGLDAELLLGYSPMVRPMWIKTMSVGGVDYAVPVAVAADDIALSDYITNSSGQAINQRATTQQFVAPFPVEAIVWHGDADSNVALGYSEQFVRTARNAGSNVKLRLCPNCVHDLNTYVWVMNEVVAYIKEKLGC